MPALSPGSHHRKPNTWVYLDLHADAIAFAGDRAANKGSPYIVLQAGMNPPVSACDATYVD
jgi:hypothetical protein